MATIPPTPRGWFHVCQSRALDRGPIGYDLDGRRFVAFRARDGKPAVLDARCSHMSADLSRGCVDHDGLLHCPLHDWHYDRDGRCVRIPASDEIPPFARQATYPTEEIAGHVVFFNAPRADFPMPFFEGRTPQDLCPARPFDLELDCPWYLVGANGFDVQHFRVAHDRTLMDEPAVDSPAEFARRMIASYAVSGEGARDSLIRRFAGPRVRMSVTSWAGVNVLASATFRRTTTYGMVFVRPLARERTLLRTIVWIARHGDGPIARHVIDPLAAAIRRNFIQGFLGDDAARAAGARYNPATLIDADRQLKDYFDWLFNISRRDGGPNGEAESGDGRPRVGDGRDDEHVVARADDVAADDASSRADHHRRTDAGDQPDARGAG